MVLRHCSCVHIAGRKKKGRVRVKKELKKKKKRCTLDGRKQCKKQASKKPSKEKFYGVDY